MRPAILAALCIVAALFASAQEKARVFISESQSWEVEGRGGGTRGAWGNTERGGARPQTVEIIKTFGERCPQVTVNNIQTKSDYIVFLDHEGGKGFWQHKNKVAVFTRVSGDSLMSDSTLSLGASVQQACEAITKDWAENADKLRAAESADQSSSPTEETARIHVQD